MKLGVLVLSLTLVSLYSDVVADVSKFPEVGECPCPTQQVDVCSRRRFPRKFCPRLISPFCGSDGFTYLNKCEFCNAVDESGGKLKLKHKGVCKI